MNTEQKIDLYYTDGSSDKEYHCKLYENSEGRWCVDFSYGRRGSTLTKGSKTSSPLGYDKAKVIYDKLVTEKKSKGYVEGIEGTPFASSEFEGQISGLVPQLLNPILEEELDKYINDDNWAMQEKMDGQRRMIVKTGNEVIGSNRKGIIVALPENIVNVLRVYKEDFTLDGEIIADQYHIFDILSYKSEDLRDKPFKERVEQLHVAVGLKSFLYPVIQIVKTKFTNQQKRDTFNQLKQRKREGVVFKHLDSKYVPGRPNSGGNQIKFKFLAAATCKVSAINVGKRSVSLEMACGTPVGNVTIYPNFLMPSVGDLVEVQYMNANLGGSLYQPVYLGVRDDIDTADELSSLKFKE